MSKSNDPYAENPSPIYAAVMYRDRAGLQKLIANGRMPDLNGLNGENIPLLTAVASDQIEIAEDLAKAGADPFASDEFGITACEFLKTSRVFSSMPEGAARVRLIKWLIDKKFPVQNCSRARIKSLMEKKQWPEKVSEREKPLADEEIQKIAANEYHDAKNIDLKRIRKESFGAIFWGKRKQDESYPEYAVVIEKYTGAIFQLGDKDTFDRELAAFKKLWSEHLEQR